jgi:mRNA interferase RelE/StbE
MAPYELRFRTSVAEDLRGLPKIDLKRILSRIEALRMDPRPPGCEKSSGDEKYRLRQGNHRIFYCVDDASLLAQVVKIGHHSKVYR